MVVHRSRHRRNHPASTVSVLSGRTGSRRQQVIRRMVKVNTAMAKRVEDISYNTHGFQ